MGEGRPGTRGDPRQGRHVSRNPPLKQRRYAWSLKEAAVIYGVSPGSLLTTSKSRSVARARQLAMAVMRERWGYSFPEIGSLFEKDHSTVMHACRHVPLDLVKRLSAYAEAAGLDEGLAEVVPEISTPEGRLIQRYPQVSDSPAIGHFLRRFMEVR